MSELRVRFFLTKAQPPILTMYRMMREIGFDRYTVNAMCVGACTIYPKLGKVEIRRPA